MPENTFLLTILATAMILALFLDADFLLKEAIFITMACVTSTVIDIALLNGLHWLFVKTTLSHMITTVCYVVILFSIFVIIRIAQVLAARNEQEVKP